MHAVIIINMKCVSFVYKCVNVSVPFLIFSHAQISLQFNERSTFRNKIAGSEKKLITKVKGHYLMSENDPLVLIPRKCPVVTVKCGPCNRQIT